jgi:hypothetical protein
MLTLTERGSAVHAAHRLENPFREHARELAPLANEVLLLRDIFGPLTVVRIRRRPERRLVELASEVHERDREARFAAHLRTLLGGSASSAGRGTV